MTRSKYAAIIAQSVVLPGRQAGRGWPARCYSAYLNGSRGSLPVRSGVVGTGRTSRARPSHNLLLYDALARKPPPRHTVLYNSHSFLTYCTLRSSASFVLLYTKAKYRNEWFFALVLDHTLYFL